MINVPLARQALAAAKGDNLIIGRTQLDDLYDEVERGQRAQVALANLTIAAVAASAAV